MHQGIQNEIYFIESNPAFEFWLLLHFVFTDRQFRNCDEVITELKKNGRLEKYEKALSIFKEQLISPTQRKARICHKSCT